MAKLTTAQRKKLPAKDFAGPGRSFPIENKAHAVQAERMAPRAVKAGSITPPQAQKIKKAAARVAGNKLPPQATKSASPKPTKPAGKSDEFDHQGIPHHVSMKPYVSK